MLAPMAEWVKMVRRVVAVIVAVAVALLEVSMMNTSVQGRE